MEAIPSYVMQGVALSMYVCEKIDKVSWDFIWGSTEDKRKLHHVGWGKIVKSKEEGGLGLQSARAKNIDLLAKLNWRLNKKRKPYGQGFCLINTAPKAAKDLKTLISSLALLPGQQSRRDFQFLKKALGGIWVVIPILAFGMISGWKAKQPGNLFRVHSHKGTSTSLLLKLPVKVLGIGVSYHLSCL